MTPARVTGAESVGIDAARTRDGPPARRTLLISLAAAALVLTGGAVYVSAVSRHAPYPETHAALTVVVCFTFVGAGLLALRQRPYARFGWLLVAVGFSSLLASLHDENHAIPYTIGVLTANLIFAVLVESLLGFPHGRLGSRPIRLLVLVAYLDVLALQAVAVLFDPLTRWHSDHPRNVALLASHAGLATALEELEAAIAVAVVAAVLVVLRHRARAATPAARRQLGPVLWGGQIALACFAVGLVLAPISSDAAVVGIGFGTLAALALPATFLRLLLDGRLSRGAVGELLLELREPGGPIDLEDALRRALGDPTLALARGDPDGYVDARGEPLELPGPGGPRVTTPILHAGEPVGALVHDRMLRLRPELVEAVSAAAGFALANEQALEALRRTEHRNRALLDAIPDPMLRVTRDGTYLDAHADHDAGLIEPGDQLIGRNIRDVIPPPVAERLIACVEETLDGGRVHAIEYELEIDGDRRWKESRMVPSGESEVVTIVRDFTEQRRADAELRRLATEQAALRRVATLVAGDPPPDEVFQAVTEEVCGVLGLRTVVLHRFEGPLTSTIVGKFGEPTGMFEIGNTIRLEVGTALSVARTGSPARSNYLELKGPGAAQLRSLGFHSSLGVPISVGGVTWGALVVALREDESLPLETERRLESFAELVGLAVGSAHAREELSASRRRIVEASDQERRRIERNLHDGAQQRLVALAVALRVARAKLQRAPEEAEEMLERASSELVQALAELRELAQGIHPAVLTERGLAEALEVLAARAPLPVSVEVGLPERLPEPVEAAAYYVVAEALANVAKHARAGSAGIRVERRNGDLEIEIADDGIGGARIEGGSGLFGLRDRVETLDGRLRIESEDGAGTRVRADLPVRTAAGEGRRSE